MGLAGGGGAMGRWGSGVNYLIFILQTSAFSFHPSDFPSPDLLCLDKLEEEKAKRGITYARKP